MNMKNGLSHNYADSFSISGIMRVFLEKIKNSIDVCLPVKVVAYDRKENTVSVEHCINMLSTKGETISRGKVMNVPVFNFGGGGFVMSFPLNAGDFGWLVASDRDISLFKQNKGKASPNTLRKHNFSDAFFIPDKIFNTNIDADDMSAFILQSIDGATKFVMQNGEIKICAENIKIVSQQIDIEGNVSLDGDLDVAGEVSASKDVITNGVSLLKHVHTGVTAGGSTSGGPK